MKKSAIISFYNTQGDRGAAGPRPAPAPTGPCARKCSFQRAASASKASARACRSRASASQPAPWRCAESPSALPEKAAAPVGLQQPPPVARAAAHGCGVVGVPAHALRRLLYGRLALALPLERLERLLLGEHLLHRCVQLGLQLLRPLPMRGRLLRGRLRLLLQLGRALLPGQTRDNVGREVRGEDGEMQGGSGPCVRPSA